MSDETEIFKLQVNMKMRIFYLFFNIKRYYTFLSFLCELKNKSSTTYRTYLFWKSFFMPSKTSNIYREIYFLLTKLLFASFKYIYIRLKAQIL